MLFDIFLIFECLAALVALEWSLPSVFPHVFLQFRRLETSIVALVTLDRLFSCMLPHYVIFQLACCNA